MRINNYQSHFIISNIFVILLLQSCSSADNPSLWMSYNTGHIIYSVADKYNNVWGVTLASSVKEISGGSVTTWDYSNTNNAIATFDGGPLYTCCLDSSGNIWFTSDSGAIKTDGKIWNNYSLRPILTRSFAHNQCLEATCDKFGIIWLATTGGIIKCDGAPWSLFDQTNSNGILSEAGVDHITSDVRGNIWAALDSTLYRFDGKNWSLFNSSNTNSKLRGRIFALSSDHNGNIFVGTAKGLSIFDGTNWTNYNTTANTLPSDTVRCIVLDKNNIPWLAVNRAVGKFEDNTFMSVSPDNGIVMGEHVSTIAVDRYNSKWFGFSDIENMLKYSGE